MRNLWNLASRNVCSNHSTCYSLKLKHTHHAMRILYFRPLTRPQTHFHFWHQIYTHISNEFRCKFNSCLLVHKQPYFSLLHNIYDMDVAVAVAVAIVVVRTHGWEKKNSETDFIRVRVFSCSSLCHNSLALSLEHSVRCWNFHHSRKMCTEQQKK